MKATGIIRRIDELGRIVIPKEFRRSLRIEEYDPMEIYTNAEGGIILKKYYPLSNLGNYIPEYADTLHWSLGCDALICDKYTIIAAAGPDNKTYMGEDIHQDLRRVISHGSNVRFDNKEFIRLTSDPTRENYMEQLIAPICFNGDPIGAVILLAQQPPSEASEVSMKMADAIAHLISKSIDY